MSEQQDGESMASKGGKAAAEKMTPEERSERAKKGADARWSAGLPRATHGDPDHPLRIGNVEINCYVLNDGRRILHQRAMVTALGMSRGSSGGEGGDRLAKFVGGDRLKGFVSSQLVEVTANPIKFKTPNGQVAYGYEATVLADICDAVLAARKAGVLQKQQQHIADQCELLLRGFARVGIVALVDEATGYQYARTREELQRILEQYISKELASWQPTFDPDFYKHMFRLLNWRYDPNSSRRPIHAARLTIDLVYQRIHPDLLKELKTSRAEWESGGKKKGGKLHQFLTTDAGHPRLRTHLAGVIVAMKLSNSWAEFAERMDMLFPKLNHTPSLPFMYADDEEEAGQRQD